MDVELVLDGVTARVTLLEMAAPRTTKALWEALPISDRAVQVKWSGDAWRTEGDYDIGITAVENEGHVLAAGDLIYYPRMKKIGLAYGRAEWRHPDLSFALHVSVIGRVSSQLEAVVAASRRVWLEGARPLRLSRAE
ncbi:MAG TPA: DUF3830 family protein [bacterium]|nr:DUF3830 family protein [bacterium]